MNKNRSRHIRLPSFRSDAEDYEDEKLPAFRRWKKWNRRRRNGERCGPFVEMILRVPVPATFSAWLKIITPIVIVVCVCAFFLDMEISLQVYRKAWVNQEIRHVEPLSGCFEPSHISPLYNLTLARGPKYFEVHAGTPMRLEFDCYNFAGTIPREPAHHISRTIYHTYWRSDLLAFDERQVWMLKSFFATQNLRKSKLILWSNGDLSDLPAINDFLHRYPRSFELRVANMVDMARGTALEGSQVLESSLNDQRAWVDGDLVRLLVVWHFGGVWVDMDSLLTRDLAPLLEHEFVTQWDCFDKKYMALNGALLHFHQHSPYLCEAFHVMATDRPPNPNTIDWGSLLYHKLWRRILNAGIEPFKILPWCFSDGFTCALDNQLPDPLAPDPVYWGGGRTLEEGGPLDEIVSNKIFSVHLHNRWEKAFPSGGWVERLLLRRYDLRIGR